jgi:CheY-like chemotaxis protein
VPQIGFKSAVKSKILIVEDGSSTGWLISLILSDAGYSVVGPAVSNATAVDLIASDAPNAAFLDVTLG